MTKIIPNRIKQLREKRGLTQRELAEKIGVSEQHMNKMENHNKPVTMTNAALIANALGVTLNDIFLPNDCSK